MTLAKNTLGFRDGYITIEISPFWRFVYIVTQISKGVSGDVWT
jgi:hypothetical protein